MRGKACKQFSLLAQCILFLIPVSELIYDSLAIRDTGKPPCSICKEGCGLNEYKAQHSQFVVAFALPYNSIVFQ